MISTQANKSRTQRSQEQSSLKAPLTEINLKDEGTRQNLLTQMAKGDFSVSVDSLGRCAIRAGDAKIHLSVPATQRAAVASLMNRVKDDLAFYDKGRHAVRLLNDLERIEGVTLKSRTSFARSIDRTPSYTDVDLMATALMGKEVSLGNLPDVLFREATPALLVDGQKVEVLLTDGPARKAFVDALCRCLQTNQGASPIQRATALTRLMCSFHHDGVEIPVQLRVADLKELESRPQLKIDFPKSLTEALEISAQHLLSSPREQIAVSVGLTQQKNLWSMAIENEKSKLVFDIDPRLLQGVKDASAFLQGLIESVKDKAGALLDTEAGVTALAEFIQKKISEIPANQQGANSVAEFACAGQSAYFDMHTGKPVETPARPVPTDSSRELEKRLKAVDDPALAQIRAGAQARAREIADLQAAHDARLHAEALAHGQARVAAQAQEASLLTAPRPQADAVADAAAADPAQTAVPTGNGTTTPEASPTPGQVIDAVAAPSAGASAVRHDRTGWRSMLRSVVSAVGDLLKPARPAY